MKASETWPLAVISQAWSGRELPELLTHDTELEEMAVGSKLLISPIDEM